MEHKSICPVPDLLRVVHEYHKKTENISALRFCLYICRLDFEFVY